MSGFNTVSSLANGNYQNRVEESLGRADEVEDVSTVFQKLVSKCYTMHVLTEHSNCFDFRLTRYSF